MDYTKLKTELADPKYAALIAAGNDQGCADMLTAIDPAIMVPQLTPRYLVKNVLYASGEILAIKGSGTPAAQMAVLFMNDPDYENLDFTIPAVPALFQSLKAAELLSDASLTAITALSTTQGSRAQQLGLGNVSVTDIAQVVRDDHGNRLI